MSMNWGDSSDDEDDNFFAPENNPPVVAEREEEPASSAVVDDQVEAPRPVKEFILPEHAPYTAFVGNLAFSIRDPQQLADAISDLVRQRFGEEIVITAKRVALDRLAGDKPKGFGYVEVETVEHLKSVLKLNDGQSMIAGRYIHLDVAQPMNNAPSRQSSRSSSFGGDHGSNNVDGTKFQGGRYNKEGSGSFRRKESGGSFQRSESTGLSAPAPLGERPSLKLQPRSQTEGSVPSSSSTSASSIFGGAKPRDQDSWERGRDSSAGGDAKGAGGDRRPRNTSSGRGKGEGRGESGGRGGGAVRDGGRGISGGRGGGAGRDGGRSESGGRGGGAGRDGGRGRGDRKPARQSSTGRGGGYPASTKPENKTKEEATKKTVLPAAAVVAEPEKAAGAKKVTNKFAALNFDDSDEE